VPDESGEKDKISVKGEVDEIKDVKDNNKVSNMEESRLMKEGLDEKNGGKSKSRNCLWDCGERTKQWRNCDVIISE